MKKIIFKNMQSPGDILMLQLAVRELHKSYPNVFETDIISPYPEITYGNPFLTRLIPNGMKDPDADIVEVGYTYELKRGKFSGSHFSDGFITDINHKLGLNINKKDMYPSIYLKNNEENDIKKKYDLPDKFWIFNAGIKIDIPLKSWILDYWIDLFDMTRGINLIQVGSNKHVHPDFGKDITSLIGKTECLREFIKVCYHAEGYIGPISMGMHIMAAFNKPAIIIAGGRECPTWEFYPTHQFLHTVGILNCCKRTGCYKSQRDECENIDTRFNYPKCMTMIYPAAVLNKLALYL